MACGQEDVQCVHSCGVSRLRCAAGKEAQDGQESPEYEQMCSDDSVECSLAFLSC